jgi:hypothetical protein
MWETTQSQRRRDREGVDSKRNYQANELQDHPAYLNLPGDCAGGDSPEA